MPPDPRLTATSHFLWALALVLPACTLNTRGDGQNLGDASVVDSAADTFVSVDVQFETADEAEDGSIEAAACTEGSRVCADQCVAVTDPAYGCKPESCSPACVIKHGKATCSNGACAVGACDEGWGDCDANASNGCETDLHTLKHCGQCGVECTIAHGLGSCSAGACTVLSCEAQFLDCNKDPSDGCEADINSPKSCGGCDKVCTVASGTPSCVAGICGVSDCPAGFGNCNGEVADGCEADLSKPEHCGTCSNQCKLAHANAKCVSGQCVIDTCQDTYRDCDNNPATGCETDVAINPDHCGSCGGACSLDHASKPSCAGGLCFYTCENGFFDCNGPSSGATDDGCEAEVAADPNNCGKCGRACSLTGVDEPACAASVCTSSCLPGLSNCNMPDLSKPDDGCETDVLSNVEHCGACSAPCEMTHSMKVECKLGLCEPTCSDGFGNCNGALPGAVDDGCEVNFNTPDNCGSCNTPCVLVNATSATCQAGLCSFACSLGFGDCNGPQSPWVADGCELPTTSDPDNCGGCGLVCGSAHTTNRTCVADKCVLTCASGWEDCDKTGAAPGGNNGCETHIAEDVDHCGSCYRPCSGSHVDDRSCSGGKCNSSCDFARMNCSEPAAPEPDDGCETGGWVCF